MLGYLIAGVIIGPFCIGLVGEEGQDIMHFAEFGVVMMLFVIGLELQPALLWKLRGPILGLGGIQVLGTMFVVCIVALIGGYTWQKGLAIGMIIALSSTAYCASNPTRKRAHEIGNQVKMLFSVLLFQDIAVIPMLSLLPLLAMNSLATHADNSHDQAGWLDGFFCLGTGRHCSLSFGSGHPGRYLYCSSLTKVSGKDWTSRNLHSYGTFTGGGHCLAHVKNRAQPCPGNFSGWGSLSWQ